MTFFHLLQHGNLERRTQNFRENAPTDILQNDVQYQDARQKLPCHKHEVNKTRALTRTYPRQTKEAMTVDPDPVHKRPQGRGRAKHARRQTCIIRFTWRRSALPSPLSSPYSEYIPSYPISVLCLCSGSSVSDSRSGHQELSPQETLLGRLRELYMHRR